MKQVILLSTVFSFLSFFINSREVLAADIFKSAYKAVSDPFKDKPKTKYAPVSPQDPRVSPAKYCQAKCAPTIHPVAPFDIIDTTKTLRSAVVGKYTRAVTVTTVVATHSAIQRLEIVNAYETRYTGDHNDRGDSKLVSNLRRRLGAKFESSIAALLMPLPVFLAKELKESMVPGGTDEVTIAEILCSINNFGIKAVSEFYEKAYQSPLEKAIAGSTTGSFQKVMVSLVQGKRSEQSTVDRPKVEADAKALTKPGPKNWKVATSEFNNILGTTRSYSHLRDVFSEYRKISGHEIEDDIKKEFPGTTSAGLLANVKCIKSRPEFLATRLHESINGKRQDRPIIRIIVSRSEIDLAEIMTTYEKLFKKNVRNEIGDKLSGGYRRTLTNVVLGRQS